MKIVPDYTGNFVIMNGVKSETFFSFFVDDLKSAWSKHPWNARRFRTRKQAQASVAELQRRRRAKQEGR